MFSSENVSEILDKMLLEGDVTTDIDILRVNHPPPIGGSQQIKKVRQRRWSKVTNVPYSTDLQRRRKAELDALRSEARELSEQLEHLLPLHHSHTTKGMASSVMQSEQLHWRRQAIIKCEERVRAERLNRELKVIYAQYIKLFKSARKVLVDSDTLEGVEFVGKLLPIVDRPLLSFDITNPILAELSNNLHRMYLDTDVVSPSFSDSLSISFCTQVKLREDHKMVIETTSITPLTCSVAQAGGILWHYVTNKDNSDTKLAFDFNSVLALKSDGADDRSYITSLFVQNNDLSPRYVVAIAKYQKYEDENRVVLVGSRRWLLPGECLQYEGEFWTIIEPSPVDSGYSSVVRTHHQVRSKDSGMDAICQEQTTRDTLQQSIANMSRLYLQSMQNAFVELDATHTVVEAQPSVSPSSFHEQGPGMGTDDDTAECCDLVSY